MRFHRSYHSLPELAHLSGRERKLVWARCVKRGTRGWPTWRAVAAVFAVAAPCSWFVGRLARHLLDDWRVWVRGMLPGGLLGLCFGFAYAFLLMHRARRFLPAELPDRCHQCGYDLTGNSSGRCPECGGEVMVVAPAGPPPA